MLHRFIAVFLTLAVVICVCVPVFAAPIEESIWDYADVQVDGFTKKVTVRFPDDMTQITLIGDNWSVLAQETGNNSTFDLATYPQTFRIYFSPLGHWFKPYGSSSYDGIALDLSDIPADATFTLSVSARADSIDFRPGGYFMAWFVDGYLDTSSGLIGGSQEFTMELTHPEEDLWQSTYQGNFRDTSRPYACQVEFAFQHAPSGRWNFSLDDFVIETTIDALKQLEANTGRTNELLDEVNKKLDDITDRPPDPVEPTWGESAGDAEEKEDQIIDQLDPDKVTNDLADMHLTLVDNLLLYTNAFAAISALWVVLIDLPFIKIILYCSLLFGLLAAFLGMGLAAGRASDRHSGRSSGKKGK